MKKIVFISLLSIGLTAYALNGMAQAPVTYLNENFDVNCASGGMISHPWVVYNPPATGNSIGAWHCDALNGRKNAAGGATPGIVCTGVWSGSYHLDSSYIISPQLDLSSYSKAFLYFDTKEDSLSPDGKISLFITRDSLDTTFFHSMVLVDTTSSITPLFTAADASGWVTHGLQLSEVGPGSRPFYIAFRYTSSTSTGSMWYLDNVNIFPYRLNVAVVNNRVLPFTTLGYSSSSHISLSFGSKLSGAYQLGIYNMMGTIVYREKLNLREGSETYSIDGLNLPPGMYCIKLGDGNAYGITKVVIQ